MTAFTWDEIAAVIGLASSGGHHVAGTPATYRHGWVKLADEIEAQGRHVAASGQGDRHGQVGYRMTRAAEELRAGNRKAALGHLHAARLDSMGQGRRSGRPGMGSVVAPGLGPAHSLIAGHIRAAGNLPS